MSEICILECKRSLLLLRWSRIGFLALIGVTALTLVLAPAQGLWAFLTAPPPFRDQPLLALAPYALGLSGGAALGLAWFIQRPLRESSFRKDVVGGLGIVASAVGLGVTLVLSIDAARDLQLLVQNQKAVQDTSIAAVKVANDSSDRSELVRLCIEQEANRTAFRAVCDRAERAEAATDQFQALHGAASIAQDFTRALAFQEILCSVAGVEAILEETGDLADCEKAELPTTQAGVLQCLQGAGPIAQSFERRLQALWSGQKALNGVNCADLPILSLPAFDGDGTVEIPPRPWNDFWSYYGAPMIGLAGVGAELSILLLVWATFWSRLERSKADEAIES